MTTAVAAPAAAPAPAQAPVTTPGGQTTPQPNGGANPQPGGAQNANQGQEAANQRARIELSKMDPNTLVVLPVDGRDVEMTAAEAFKRLGRAESANKRFEEAARARRQAEADQAELRGAVEEIAASIGDPRRFRQKLTEFGIDARSWAAMLQQIEAEEAGLTPEQRKIREYEDRERQRQLQEQQAQEQQYQAERQHYRAAYAQALHGAMTEYGIAQDSPLRDFFMPTLAQAAAHILQTEGRNLRKSECRAIMDNAISKAHELASGRMTPEQRRALMTEEDWAWYQGERLKRRPQATPQLPGQHHSREQPRTEAGQFRNPGEVDAQGRPVRRNVNGKIIVDNAYGLYGRR